MQMHERSMESDSADTGSMPGGYGKDFGVERRYDYAGVPIKDSITILTKVKIIRDCEAGLSRELIRQKYNLKSVNNISRIMINKRKFVEAYENNLFAPDRKTLKTTRFASSSEVRETGGGVVSDESGFKQARALKPRQQQQSDTANNLYWDAKMRENMEMRFRQPLNG